MEQRPLDALNAARGKKVFVDLKNGKTYSGSLQAFDIHLNLVLSDVEERMGGEITRKLNKILVRGDTILIIAPEE
jgi:small nuclear ribonucleoprotein